MTRSLVILVVSFELVVLCAFFLLEGQNEERAKDMMEDVARDARTVNDPYLLSQAVSDLESFGLIECPVVGLKDQASDEVRYLDHSFKSDCNNILFPFTGRFVSTGIVDAAGRNWLLSFRSVNPPYFAMSLLLATLGTFLLTVSIYFILRQRLRTVEQIEGAKRSAVFLTTQMLVHDVRKPISIAKLTIKMLSKGKMMDDVYRIVEQASVSLERASDRVDAMIEDVLAFRSQKTLEKQPISLNLLIADTLENCLSDKPNINCEMSLIDEHKIAVDAPKIERVISNLVTNALEAMENSGHLRVSSWKKNDRIFVTVSNTGSYIEDGDRQKLFDAFFTKGKKRGTGLGLAIVKKIVNDHGGEISCNSSKSKGTEFTFWLPIGP